jgi:hypothetical protein
VICSKISSVKELFGMVIHVSVVEAESGFDENWTFGLLMVYLEGWMIDRARSLAVSSLGLQGVLDGMVMDG